VKRPRGPRLRRAASIAVVALLAVGAVLKREAIGDAVEQVRAVDRVDFAVLLTAWALHAVSRAWGLTVSLPGMRLRHSILATEATAGVGNAVPGGAAIGQAVRVAMCRSWGMTIDAIALSMLATGTATFTVLWALPVAALGPRGVVGDANAAEVVVVVVALGVIAATVIAWVTALRSTRLSDRTGALLAAAVGRVAAGVPELAGRDWSADVRAVRVSGRLLWRRRGPALIAASAGYQLGMFLVLAAAMRAIDPVGLSTADAFRAFALVRIVTVIIPTPGGLGTVDAGLTVALADAGASDADAIAVVLLFRSFTYVLPMLTGAAGYLTWRARFAIRPAPTPRSRHGFRPLGGENHDEKQPGGR
jgi:putative heme transporter